MDIYGLQEFADRMGVSKQYIREYMKRSEAKGWNGIPEPRYRLKCGPIWTADQVDAYMKGREERAEK